MAGNDLLHRVASNLRTLRDERGISRERLAATTQIDPQLIKRIENGSANPALTVLSRLGSALMISVSLMLGEIAPSSSAEAAEVPVLERETIGETIATLRRQRQRSRHSVASRAALRSVTLSRYESGEVDARLLSLDALARALDLTAPDLLRVIEARQREIELARQGWASPATGVQCRAVANGEASQLWEWRIEPGMRFLDESVTASEEIATATRGEVTIELRGQSHRLRRGASLAIPGGAPLTLGNSGSVTARVLRFRVRK